MSAFPLECKLHEGMAFVDFGLYCISSTWIDEWRNIKAGQKQGEDGYVEEVQRDIKYNEEIISTHLTFLISGTH